MLIFYQACSQIFFYNNKVFKNVMRHLLFLEISSFNQYFYFKMFHFRKLLNAHPSLPNTQIKIMCVLLLCGDTNFCFLNERFPLFFIHLSSKYFWSKIEQVLELFNFVEVLKIIIHGNEFELGKYGGYSYFKMLVLNNIININILLLIICKNSPSIINKY